ncbi:matrix metalloproteinase-20-like [Erpetoichthys calabaricus]|uniref:matrix metalloproteinase-20-like n=1 Tax=Erpetoichthys calabaricus TaxID=27687 RepID=UPI0010A0219E|nr:matrix metalloproteinase-20-like [Erpetoichthys calabaricus]
MLQLCLLQNVFLIWSKPVLKENSLQPDDVDYARAYLKMFYNLTEARPGRAKRHTPELERKTKEMQSFFGLEVTGQLNPQTIKVMKIPRCGVPDVENYHFYPGKPKWRNRTITYRIAKYTPDLSPEEVERSFHMAFKIWSDAAPLKLVKIDKGEADILIDFASRTHGDFFPFDGPRGVLAHAFEPGEDIGGDTHFDEDEIWTMGNTKPGYNLFTVAAHEFGHALGLSHSRDPTALMYPTYKYYNSGAYTLPRDDVLGIQALYGEKNAGRPEVLTVPTKCDPTLSFDAVAGFGNEIAFFKNRYMWFRGTWMMYWNLIREGFINKLLKNFHSSIDAAYDIPGTGITYLFTGPKYWILEQATMKSYARSIYDFGFPTTVKQIDAAVYVKETGKTFFFTGDLYYRYDERLNKMDSGYPRSIQNDWPGIGSKVDAAFELAGYIHFFSGPKAYKYDYQQKYVLYAVKANAWLGC